MNPFFGVRIGRNPPERSGPAFLFANGLLIFSSLTGTVFFFVRTYLVDVNLWMVFFACLIFSVISLFVFSLLKYHWTCLAVLTVVFCLIVYWQLDTFVNGAQAVYSSVAKTLTDGMSFPGYYNPAAKLSAEDWRNASGFFMISASFVLSMLLGWAVVRIRSFLSVFALTFPWLLFGFLAEIPVDWMSAIVVIACWLTLLMTSLSAQANPRGRAWLVLVSMGAVMLAIGLVSIFSPRSGYMQPAWARNAQHELINWGVRLSENLSDGAKDFASGLGGPTIPTSDGHVSLENAGPLRYTGRTVLRVETGSKGRMYLRGRSAADYTGTSWEPLGNAALSALNQTVSENRSIFFPAFGAGESGAASVKVTNTGAAGGTLYYPYQPVNDTADMLVAQLQEDSYLAIDYGISEYTVMFRPVNENSLYSDRAVYPEDEPSYCEFVYQHYLDVPDGFIEAMTEWSNRSGWTGFESTAGTDSTSGAWRIGEADRIAQMLSETTEYDPHTPVTPEGEDFVGYFLNVSKRGYCMHYASAATLLLRAQGIPARYVSGFVFDVSATGTTEVPDSAAHAWVEIYLDSYGWYPVEVTAPFRADSSNETEESPEALPEDPDLPQDSPAVESPSPTEAPSESDGLYSGNGAGLGWLYISLAVLLLLSLPVLFRYWLAFRWRRLHRITDNNRAVIEAYGYFERLERWGGRTEKRTAELVGKARFSQYSLTWEERMEVFNALYADIADTMCSLTPIKRTVFIYLFNFKNGGKDDDIK